MSPDAVILAVAEAVAVRDAVWREAVQAIGDEYGILKYRICEEILAEVERRTKGASDGP